MKTAPDISFDSETMQAMSEAFDIACEALRGFAQFETVQEVIATQIVDLAREGERDPVRLYEHALRELGIENASNQLIAA